MQDNCNFGVLVCFLSSFFFFFAISANVWRWIRKDLRSFLMTLCFQCSGRGFDPWLGKFHMPCDTARKKKTKRFQWTLSCFQSYAFVANQELLISTFLPLHSCELSSKTPVAAFIIMLSVRLAHSTTLFWILPFISGRKFPLRQKLKDFYVPELQGLVQWAFERTIWRVQQRHSHVLLSECTI